MPSATIHFEADAATLAALESGAAQAGHPDLKFRGHLKEAVHSAPAPLRAFGGPVEMRTLSVQSDRELVAASQALARANVKAWVTVATPQGPQPMELGEFIRQMELI